MRRIIRIVDGNFSSCISVYGMEIEDAPDWVNVAKSMSKWHLGVEKEVEELEGAR